MAKRLLVQIKPFEDSDGQQRYKIKIKDRPKKVGERGLIENKVFGSRRLAAQVALRAGFDVNDQQELF